MRYRDRWLSALVRAALATFLLAGCATAAQRQAQETGNITQAAGAKFKEYRRFVIDSSYFGSTKQGKFVRQHEADREGDRPTRNGQ